LMPPKPILLMARQWRPVVATAQREPGSHPATLQEVRTPEAAVRALVGTWGRE
jgi:hypothetical protein